MGAECVLRSVAFFHARQLLIVAAVTICFVCSMSTSRMLSLTVSHPRVFTRSAVVKSVTVFSMRGATNC